jgi:hypothetical protein
LGSESDLSRRGAVQRARSRIHTADRASRVMPSPCRDRSFRGAARWDSIRGIRILPPRLVTVVRALPSSRSASNPADISPVLSRPAAPRKAALRGLERTARACRRSPELRRSLEGPHGLPIRRAKLISAGRRWALRCRPRAQARGFEGPQGLRRKCAA